MKGFRPTAKQSLPPHAPPPEEIVEVPSQHRAMAEYNLSPQVPRPGDPASRRHGARRGGDAVAAWRRGSAERVPRCLLPHELFTSSEAERGKKRQDSVPARLLSGCVAYPGATEVDLPARQRVTGSGCEVRKGSDTVPGVRIDQCVVRIPVAAGVEFLDDRCAQRVEVHRWSSLPAMAMTGPLTWLSGMSPSATGSPSLVQAAVE